MLPKAVPINVGVLMILWSKWSWKESDHGDSIRIDLRRVDRSRAILSLWVRGVCTRTYSVIGRTGNWVSRRGLIAWGREHLPASRTVDTASSAGGQLIEWWGGVAEFVYQITWQEKTTCNWTITESWITVSYQYIQCIAVLLLLALEFLEVKFWTVKQKSSLFSHSSFRRSVQQLEYPRTNGHWNAHYDAFTDTCMDRRIEDWQVASVLWTQIMHSATSLHMA